MKSVLKPLKVSMMITTLVLVVTIVITTFPQSHGVEFGPVPPPVTENPKFIDRNNLTELINSPENTICRDPQIYQNSECYLLAAVMYDGNNTAILRSHSDSYTGAVIDLMKSEGYTVDTIMSPTQHHSNKFVIFFSKP